MPYTLPELNRIYKKAVQDRTNFDHLMKDVYRYAIIGRDMYNNTTPGTDTAADIFDSTAIDSTENFANFIHANFFPSEYRWFEFAAGSDIPEAQKGRVQTLLDAVTEVFFNLLWATNFDTEINQCCKDIAGGNACLGLRDYGTYGSDNAPATFVATPPYEVYYAEGREGHIKTIFRVFSLDKSRIKSVWPDAVVPEDYSGKPDEPMKVVECCYYDYDTKLYTHVVYKEGETETPMLTYTNDYATWIVFRWSVVTGEVYGRGPLNFAMPDIKTCNKVVELVLKNASISLSGIYTAVDDGVLNPNSIVLNPGVVIPVAYNGGPNGRSLDVLPRNGEFDVSQLVLKDLRQSIRRKLFDDDTAPLDDAVRSSREVAMRMQDAASRMGSGYGRIKTEFIVEFIKNVSTMWQKKGLLPPFAIDGKNITIRLTSPMAKLQKQEDLTNLDSFIFRLNTLQPGLAPLAIKPEEYVQYVGEKSDISFKLLNDKEQLVQVQQQMGQAVAQGTPAGQAIAQGLSSG